MKMFPDNASSEDLIAAVEHWVDLLVEKKYQEALDFIYPIPYPEWDAKYLENWIGNYGFDQPLGDGKIVEITSRETASGKQYHKEYEIFQPQINKEIGLEVIGTVTYDVPLDGQWSDLTVEFDVCRYKGCLVLDMRGFHVL